MFKVNIQNPHKFTDPDSERQAFAQKLQREHIYFGDMVLTKLMVFVTYTCYEVNWVYDLNGVLRHIYAA